MQSYFANQSCDPFSDRTKPCLLGNYVSYSVKATEAWDVIAALEFAKAKNVRVLARNTGHDFLGRSTGAGALAIWTQIRVLSCGGCHDIAISCNDLKSQGLVGTKAELCAEG
jgi:hypothetical protein